MGTSWARAGRQGCVSARPEWGSSLPGRPGWRVWTQAPGLSGARARGRKEKDSASGPAGPQAAPFQMQPDGVLTPLSPGDLCAVHIPTPGTSWGQAGTTHPPVQPACPLGPAGPGSRPRAGGADGGGGRRGVHWNSTRAEMEPSFYSTGILFCSVIFVNNFAFGPEVDHQLKERFANMKEGNVPPLHPALSRSACAPGARDPLGSVCGSRTDRRAWGPCKC